MVRFQVLEDTEPRGDRVHLRLPKLRLECKKAAAPRRRPVIETVMIYSVSLGLYVFALSGIVNWCLQGFASSLALLGILLTIWITIRRGRRDG